MTKAWKNAELRVAKMFGSSRVGPSGAETNDIHHPLLAIEVKYRQKLPEWALDCLEQARTARDAAGKTPVTLMFQRGMRLRDGIVVMTVREFEELWGAFTENRTDGDSPAA